MPSEKSDADHLRVGMPSPRFKGDIAGAGRQIQQRAGPRQTRSLYRRAPPLHILPAGDDAVHEVVAFGDAVEHALHIIRAFIATQMRHSRACRIAA